MAGYAAALRVLTKYRTIDGRDMTLEALRPRTKGSVTVVEDMINFAVGVANSCLIPAGIEEKVWAKLSGPERFYLKMIDMEGRGLGKLDNYQNFAKAFKVRNFQILMGSVKTNASRLKSASELGGNEMGDSSDFHDSSLRGVLYALMEIEKGIDGTLVLSHLAANVKDFYENSQRDLFVALAKYLSLKLDGIRTEESSAARVLASLITNQQVGS